MKVAERRACAEARVRGATVLVLRTHKKEEEGGGVIAYNSSAVRTAL